MLKLFYITNNPDVAKIAQAAGVDRIFVDMEYIGKDERQPNMDTVKNHHTVEDIINLRKVLDKSELMVRINPINENSGDEIESVIHAGADIIMLPMWKCVDEVKQFYQIVNGRVKTVLLLETDDAVNCIDEVLDLKDVEEIHIGLNDLHLSQGKKFLFELLTDGTVDYLADKFNSKDITFGFGGVGRVFQDIPTNLPAENIIAEHYRLGSSMVILSRAFCNTSKIKDLSEIKKIFEEGLMQNRSYEKEIENKDASFFEMKHKETERIIQQIVSKI